MSDIATSYNKGTLYVVATPIGNLDDITNRAISVLSRVDMIAAEDTRHSRVLLAHFDIKTPLFSCHKFNEAERGSFFVQALISGKNVALISDAGTPCISDPGHRLVCLAADAGITIVAVCGANAVAAALSVSGFDASRFAFLGFLPRTQKGLLDSLSAFPQNLPLVFYESPKRIKDTLRTIEKAYPNATVCLCNDLTKKFERIYRGTASQVLLELEDNPHSEKGEYTCVVYIPEVNTDESPAINELSLESMLVDIMVKSNCTLKEATQTLHEAHKKWPKKEIYAASLRLKALI